MRLQKYSDSVEKGWEVLTELNDFESNYGSGQVISKGVYLHASKEKEIEGEGDHIWYSLTGAGEDVIDELSDFAEQYDWLDTNFSEGQVRQLNGIISSEEEAQEARNLYEEVLGSARDNYPVFH